MSVQALGWVFDEERETTGVTRLVLIAMANRINDEGIVWRSVPTIASEANCSERAVRYALQELVDKGILAKRDRHDDPRIPLDKRPYVYEWRPAIRAPRGVQTVQAAGCKPRQSGVQTTTARGAQFAGKTTTKTKSKRALELVEPFHAPPPIAEMRTKVRGRKRSERAG